MPKNRNKVKEVYTGQALSYKSKRCECTFFFFFACWFLVCQHEPTNISNVKREQCHWLRLGQLAFYEATYNTHFVCKHVAGNL